MVLHWEVVGTRSDFLSNSDNFLDSSLLSHLCHTAIERAWRFTALHDITEDKCPATVLTVWTVRTTLHEVECDIKWVYVAIVCVVDQRTWVHSVLHFKTHSHRFQFWHTRTDIVECEVWSVKRWTRRIMEKCHTYSHAGDGVLYRSGVDKRNGVVKQFTINGEMYGSGVVRFLYASHA